MCNKSTGKLTSLLIRTPILCDQDPTFMTSFTLNSPFEVSCPNTTTLAIKVPAYEFGRNRNIQFIIGTYLFDFLNINDQ